MKFFDYFHSLGFSQKEAEIYLTLYKLGTQPASVLAKYVNMERTYVYKILLELSKKNLVSITDKGGVKNFCIPDISILRRYVENEKLKYEKMHDDFSNIETELQSHKQ
jgi:sugar-specific transcriptional regulator TrmB